MEEITMAGKMIKGITDFLFYMLSIKDNRFICFIVNYLYLYREIKYRDIQL